MCIINTYVLNRRIDFNTMATTPWISLWSVLLQAYVGTAQALVKIAFNNHRLIIAGILLVLMETYN